MMNAGSHLVLPCLSRSSKLQPKKSVLCSLQPKCQANFCTFNLSRFSLTSYCHKKSPERSNGAFFAVTAVEKAKNKDRKKRGKKNKKSALLACYCAVASHNGESQNHGREFFQGRGDKQSAGVEFLRAKGGRINRGRDAVSEQTLLIAFIDRLRYAGKRADKN